MSTERRLAFRVEYDGTDYHGWQSQPTGVPTIVGALEAAIEAVLGVRSPVDGASRTDAGVHARDQLAAVTIRHPIRPEGFVKALNARLPGDIAVLEAWDVPLDFAPRFANRGKVYCYRMYGGIVRRPLVDRYAWRVQWPLDEARMHLAAAHLIGTHDFTSFAASDGGHRTAERTIEAIDLTHEPHDLFVITYRGTAFMKHMVRNLTGTLVDVGRGQLEPDRVAAILAARDRRAAGPTAPPRGLTLERMLR